MTDTTNSTRNDAANHTVVTFPTGATAMAKTLIGPEDAILPEGLPDGYQSKDDGIYEMRETTQDDVEWVRICSPLIVKGSCRTQTGKSWGRVVSVQDPDGIRHELVLNAQQLAKSPGVALAPLLDLGLELEPVTKAADSVLRLLRSWKPASRYQRFDRLGWVDDRHDAFVLGDDRVIGRALVARDNAAGELLAAMHTKGTLESWQEDVAARCVGNPLLMLGVSHAFTGPLLSILGMNGGGFHLCGVSSRGKSTIQYVATSVWGARSLMHSWDSTPSGLAAIASAFTDTFLNLEELHKADPRKIGDMVYALGDGRGRLRAKSNGIPQAPQSWRVPVLSSGELSLEEHMNSAGRKVFAGQMVRLTNLKADARAYGAFDTLHGMDNPELFVKRLDQAANATYGHAGALFVEKLMKAQDQKQNLMAFVDGFCRIRAKDVGLSGDGQVHRVLKRFAVAALAGEMATQFGLTRWQSGAATDAATMIFLDWFEERDDATSKEIEAAVKATRTYVSKNLDRFCALDKTNHPPLDGWRDQDWFYILPECWKSIHGQNDPIEMARMHAAAGLLKPQNGANLQFRMGRKTVGRPRVYAVRASAITAET